MDHRKIDAQSPEAIATIRKYVRGELWGAAIALVILVSLTFYLADEMPSARTLLHVGMAFCAGGAFGSFLIAERWLTYLHQRATAAKEVTLTVEPTGDPPMA